MNRTLQAKYQISEEDKNETSQFIVFIFIAFVKQYENSTQNNESSVRAK